MSDPNDTKAAEAAAKAAAAEKADEPKAMKAKRAEDSAELKFEGPAYTGTLTIGVEEFTVTDGKVSVPERLIPAARQAGFK